MRRYDRYNMNAFSYRVQTLQPSAIREILKFTSDPEVISFAAGNPAPEAFPTEEIARITNEILTKTPIDALQYSITEGYTPLRNWIKDDLKKKGMFDENKDDLIEEEIGENPELLESDGETETGKQAAEEVINTISLETVIQSENLQPSIAVPDHKEELTQEENKIKNVDAALKDIGGKICNQIDEETETTKLENVKKVNRIITSSVGGGFRHKSPQAEEAKEITAILKKGNKN